MIKEVIRESIKSALEDLGLKGEADINYPPVDSFGHYSTSIAFKIAKLKRENPAVVGGDKLSFGEKLAEKIKEAAPKGFFDSIEFKAPGFINFWISPSVFRKELVEILKMKDKYGKSMIHNSQFKIQIEFISANPTGPLTIANGRGGFFGDVLANILEFGGFSAQGGPASGFKVEREYYINDTGNQIITLGKSILAVLGLVKEEENFYKAGYIKEWAKKNSLRVKKFKKDYLKVGQLAAKDFLKDIKKAVEKKAKIKFDRWTSEEKDIHKKSFINKALAIFRKQKLVYEKEGAVWLKTTQFGDDKDRVLITSDGFPTYFLADAGHYLETKKRGFDRKINILGPDHYGYVKRIQAAAQIIGFKNSDIIVTQAVRLIRGGQEAKMSKRKGEFITFNDLIDEVGSDAARFFFLMYSPETHMDFNLDLAKERSVKNPVYYVQYAFVRAQSILTKVNSKFKTLNSKQIQNSKFQILNLLNTGEDINLMKMLARFPEVVKEAAGNLSPQILVRYALDLAKEFHNFYEKERVIGEEENLAKARLALIQAAFIVFQNLFKLLGISLPKKM